MIFKTSNCRNWDASVLYCHEPNLVLNPGEKILLEEEKVAVIPGAAFGLENFIRLSYATSMEVIEEGLDRIKSFLGKLK